MEIAFIIIWSILALVMVSIHIYEGIIIPVRKAPKNWIPASCEIIESKLESDTDGDGPKFWADIQYAYKYDNNDYVSNKYSLNYQQSSYKKYHKKILNNYLKGTECICYVNPKDPTEAILDRTISMGLFSLVIIAIFLILGIGMLLYALYLFTR